MIEVEYNEAEGTAVIRTETETEWLASDSVACLSEWV